MDTVTDLWKRLADGSLCREHPIKVWGVSLVLAGGIAFAVHAALATDAEPTAEQAAFDAGKAGTSAGGKAVSRVPNTSSGIAKAAGTLGKQLAVSPLLGAFAKQVRRWQAAAHRTPQHAGFPCAGSGRRWPSQGIPLAVQHHSEGNCAKRIW